MFRKEEEGKGLVYRTIMLNGPWWGCRVKQIQTVCFQDVHGCQHHECTEKSLFFLFFHSVLNPSLLLSSLTFLQTFKITTKQQKIAGASCPFVRRLVSVASTRVGDV